MWDWSEWAKIWRKYRHCEQTAGPSTAPLAMRLREAPLRMTVSKLENHLTSSYMTLHPALGGGACGGEVCKLGADAVDHGEDELFNFLGLDLCLDQELGGAEAEFGHLGL